MRPMLVLSFAALALAAAASRSNAESAHAAGQTVVSASIGTGFKGIYGTAGTPLMALSIERGVSEEFSVGGSIGYASSSFGIGDEFRWTANYLMVVGRGSYHLGQIVQVPRLDTYVGGSVGYNMVSIGAKSGSESAILGVGSYSVYGAHLGARFYFVPRLAGFAEVGFGTSNASAGLSLKF